MATQLSRNSRILRTVSYASAITLSTTLSSAVMSVIIDLPDLSPEFQPALKAIAVDYYESVSNNLDEGDCEVEFIGIVDNCNIGFVGDTVINALDTVIIGQTSSVVFSNDQPHSHRKNSKRVRQNYN